MASDLADLNKAESTLILETEEYIYVSGSNVIIEQGSKKIQYIVPLSNKSTFNI